MVRGMHLRAIPTVPVPASKSLQAHLCVAVLLKFYKKVGNDTLVQLMLNGDCLLMAMNTGSCIMVQIAVRVPA